MTTAEDDVTETMLERAKRYRDRGWRPFPVKRGRKDPIARLSWPTATASAPPDKMLERWFGGEPVNIGIAARGSNLVFLDEDVPGGLKRLCDDYGQDVPETFRVHTREGRQHWYFDAPEGIPVTNVAGLLKEQYGIDVRGTHGGVQDAGGYVVGAGSVHETGAVYTEVDPGADTVELPWWITDLLLGIQQTPPDAPQNTGSSSETPRDDRRFTREQAEQYVARFGIEPLKGAREGDRNNRLNIAACVVGHFVPALWDEMTARKRLTKLGEEAGLDRDEIRKTITSGLRAGMRQPYTIVEEDEPGENTEDDGPDSWQGIDLGPYLSGNVPVVEPTLGAARSDGVRMLYPGCEHSCIGEMECGKSWFALAHVAAELIAGRRVVYIHFEESSPADTASRLLSLGVPAHALGNRSRFEFLAPERAVRLEDIERLTEEAPSLVVLDGVNEAMALHQMGIREEDGAAAFRRRLVKPFTRVGAAVLSLDHVVKDPDRNGQGYALGSIHKGNGLSGASFLVENEEPFGKGRRGASHVFVVKDRPGELRRAGRPTKVPRKFYFATMTLDARTPGAPELRMHGPDPERSAEQAEDAKRADLHARVIEAVASISAKDGTASTAKVVERLGMRRATVLEALNELVREERLSEDYGVRNSRTYEVVPDDTPADAGLVVTRSRNGS